MVDRAKSQPLVQPRQTAIAQTRRKATAADILGNLIFVLLIVLILVFFLAPFLWMVLNSLKTPLQIIKLPPDLIFTPTLNNYRNVFSTQNFSSYILNSIIIGGGSTFFGLVLGLPAAYAVARYKQYGIATAILIARIVPGITFLIPLFILFRQLQMIDTYQSLILAHMLVGLPFIVWVMVPFFESIPQELEEAARVDGASILQAFIRIILPISGPGIVTGSILSFVFSWNNFMFSIVLATNKTKTVPVAIFNFISYAQIDWGGLMAAAVTITLPVLLLALVTQRYVIRGLTAGAVKG
jgi:multiple sugar transport system permease protein